MVGDALAGFGQLRCEKAIIVHGNHVPLLMAVPFESGAFS